MALSTPDFLQTKTYTAKALRGALMEQGGGQQNGVVGVGDLLVAQRAAGANMSVDVAAGAAWVLGTVTSRQGMYHFYNDATMNIAIAANASGNPRLDQIVMHIYDSVDGAAGQDAVQLEVIQGTATAGATLDNRTGAAALPTSSLRIADVLVANAAASIANAVIRDRRPWARGGYVATTAADLSVSSANRAETKNFTDQRLECSGATIVMTYTAGEFQSGGTNAWNIWPTIDGAHVGSAHSINTATAQTMDDIVRWIVPAPAAGSHLFNITSAANLTGQAGNLTSQWLTVEEKLQNSNNSPAGYG